MAAVKTWSAFTRRATYLHVIETDQDYTFNRFERERSAFVGRGGGKTQPPKSASREQIIALLSQYLID